MTQTETVKTTKLKPLGNRVLAQRLKESKTLAGGIVLPDSAKEKQETAQVIAVGQGKTDRNGNTTPVPVQVGDLILMDKYSGQEVTLDNEEYVIVRGDDIIAIVEK